MGGEITVSSRLNTPDSATIFEHRFWVKIASKYTLGTCFSSPKTPDQYVHPSGTQGVFNFFCSKWPYSNLPPPFDCRFFCSKNSLATVEFTD